LRSLVEKELSVQNIISKGFNEDEVKKVSQLLSIAEYKRFQSAPGPKVTDKAFGRDRRFPLTSGFSNWN
jgi:NH3-dependent NAD+ synthetase